MLSFLQRSSTWRDLTLTKRTTQVTTIDVIDTKAAESGFLGGSQTPTKPRTTPILESQYRDDAAFTRVLDLFLSPEIKKRAESELSTLSDAVISEQVFEWISEAERCPPYIRHWDAYGEKKDELVTSQGWKYLWQLGISQRIAALPSLNTEYDGYGRTIQMLKGLLFGPSCAMTGFHLVLSDGVAGLLLAHLSGSKIDAPTRALFQHAYNRLTSRDEREGWTSGLWLTERAGGSDLTPTATTATYSPLGSDTAKDVDADGFPLGPWVLDGLKWFSTGTEPSMAITIARTASGLSCFYVPMRRAVMVDGVAVGTELNGVRIRRLKQKMGTKPLATSELELKGMRGWLIGKEGKGIPEVGVVLNISRIHLTVGMCGFAGRALAAARAFARVRKVARGTRLCSVPLHMRSLARAHIVYRAHLLQAFFVTALLAKSEQSQTSSSPVLDLVPKNTQDAACLLRLLGSVAKGVAALEGLGVVHSGMEALGGLGYMENDDMAFNVARIYRDAAATCIGEGTTDVLATDAVKVMKGKIGTSVMKSYGRWIKASLPTKESLALEVTILTSQWSELQTAISSNSLEVLTMDGRSIMERVSKLTSGILLLADAARDDNPVAIEVARRWIRPTTLLSGYSVEEGLLFDQQIVFGDQPIWCGVS